MAECIAYTKNGRACRAAPVNGSQYCYTHDPSLREERKAARMLGGYSRRSSHAGDASSLPARIRSLEDVLSLLQYVLEELSALDNSVVRNRALISLAEACTKALEASELEQRISALEVQYGNKR